MSLGFFNERAKAYMSIVGVCLIYFAMGPYLAVGNMGVYLSSYLIYITNSDMKLEDSIWLLAAGGFSGLLLPLAGRLEEKIGVRSVCLIGGLGQSFGIILTYYTLDVSFLAVAITFGGAYLFSLSFSYSTPVVNVCNWHPKHRGLVTGIATAAMALGPIVFIPMITEIVNPDNLEANDRGLFEDAGILNRTKDSTLIQGIICLILFAIGIALSFPAKLKDSSPISCVNTTNTSFTNNVTSLDNDTVEKKSNVNETKMTFKFGEKFQQEVIIDSRHCSIEPKYAFRTFEFWILSLKMFITELLYIYMLFMYKPYGQTFIHDDHFLSAIGAGTAISNTIARLVMGYFKDKYGYQTVSLLMSWTTFVSISFMPTTQNLDKLFYGSAVLLAIGSVGSQYALMPSAAQDCFGNKYASINIGFVYMSMVISTFAGTFLSHYFTSLIGWNGMIYIMAGFALIDFIAAMCLPSKPAKRLIERYVQFYMKDYNPNPFEESITTISKTS